ncbi:Uma2 family endonuclease [Aeromicrobium sp. Sec7.5]|uniref:Uma2 family endonuclease n=1 Tax=Aeromicrobium sp. Sec7.5 TaxID=3121276 RepID=UPI002FE4DB88
MTTEVRTGLPRGRALTRDDLDAMPDDGHRYELVDGVLIVSPAPRRVHQRASLRLTVLLDAAVPPDLEPLAAPFDVALSDDTVMQPDLVVGRNADFTERDLPVAPVLAVEVLSPSTRGIDLLLKKDRLERAGCAHYWVVDPEEPSITAWALTEGAYRQVARAVGDEAFEVAEPFDVRVVPAELVTLSGS